MAARNNTALRILTKDKLSIISIDPKDITAEKNYVYAYPRNQSIKDTGQLSLIVLGEYEDEIYAKEVIQQIFSAITKEANTYSMPDETALDEYEDQIRKKACVGAEEIVKGNESYEEVTEADEIGVPFSYICGKMTLLDRKKEVFLTIRHPGEDHEYDFTISKNGMRVTTIYHTIHELITDRYGAFLADMYKNVNEKVNSTTHKKI